MGLVFARESWQRNASFFGAHMPSRPGIDHEVRYFGDFQLYRGGEWVLTHPIGYDASEAEHVNGMLLAGWSSMREARGLIHHGMTDDGIVVVVGANGGLPYAEGYPSPPPYFLHEWTRSLVYAPSRDGRSDVVIVHDRTLLQNPKRLRGFQTHRPADQARMNRALTIGLRQWIIHMPVRPAIEGRTISWRTDSGQPVSVTTLLPERVTHRVFDEQTELKLGGTIRPSELAWQVRVVPLDEPEWQTLLHVIHVGPGAVTATLVQEGQREGVTLVRPGHPSRTILFNAAPSAKLGSPKTAGGKSVRDQELFKRYKAFGMVEVR
jgi:hypothetical protein